MMSKKRRDSIRRIEEKSCGPRSEGQHEANTKGVLWLQEGLGRRIKNRLYIRQRGAA